MITRRLEKLLLWKRRFHAAKNNFQETSEKFWKIMKIAVNKVPSQNV